MNWTEIGDSWVSGRYTIQEYRIHRNTRGRFSVWHNPKDGVPVCLGQNLEEFDRAKTLAKNHKRSTYTGVAVDASIRG